jgi:hypothetical protein
MKLYTSDTEQYPLDNEHEVFLLGAPFSCYKFGDTWDEGTATVNGVTNSLQKPIFRDGLGKWTLISLAEFGFTTTPMIEIKSDIEAIEEGGRTDLELILLERMAELSEEHLALSVADYCDQVLTAPFFDSVDV